MSWRNLDELIVFDRRGSLSLHDASVQQLEDADSAREPFDGFVAVGILGILRRDLWRYSNANILTHDVDLIRKPFNKAVLLRLVARREIWFVDEQGKKREITAITLLRFLIVRLRAAWVSVVGRWAYNQRIRRYENEKIVRRSYGEGPILYIRTDLTFGLRSGGSVTHVAGVINEFSRLQNGANLVSTDVIPTVSKDISLHIVRPEPGLWDIPEISALTMNLSLESDLERLFGASLPRFVYQRYSLNSTAGLVFAHSHGVPFVLEYNGSEVWINRNWGRVLQSEAIALRNEILNLMNADLVVVVSQVLAEELIRRGVPERRVLINPNGVDANVYRPDLSGVEVRQQLGLEHETVVGFIGTFGPWHGAVVLVEAFSRVLRMRADLQGKLRLLMIGDGQQMTFVKQAIDREGLRASVILAGRVSQADGPAYLAACDILVSPHVPNPDGSAFFGSPTKLFEYMAMGRPIVASSLGQINEVLSDGIDALLVPPSDVQALAEAIIRLVDQPALCEELGANARVAAPERHTWKRHAERIVQRLDEQLDCQYA